MFTTRWLKADGQWSYPMTFDNRFSAEREAIETSKKLKRNVYVTSFVNKLPVGQRVYSYGILLQDSGDYK